VGGAYGRDNIGKSDGIFAKIKISLSLTEHLVQLFMGANGLMLGRVLNSFKI